MSPRSLLLFVTASLLAAASFAAEVRLGAEAARSPAASLGPAAFDQEQPDVASNGNDLLVVWIDRRSSGSDAPLFAARVGEDGHPIDARGQKLAEVGRFPQIASAGGDYLIAFANGGSYVLRVDENGRAMGEVRTLATNREPRELV